MFIFGKMIGLRAARIKLMNHVSIIQKCVVHILMQLFCTVLNHDNGIENTDQDTKNLIWIKMVLNQTTI